MEFKDVYIGNCSMTSLCNSIVLLFKENEKYIFLLDTVMALTVFRRPVDIRKALSHIYLVKKNIGICRIPSIVNYHVVQYFNFKICFSRFMII